MDWGREEVLNLIALYCNNTCLWDLDDPNYKNRDMKREALLAISNELNRDMIDVEKKMHGLRTQFNREHKRYQKQVLLNGRLREIAKPSWFAYEPLEFVAKFITPRVMKNVVKNEEESYDVSHEATWSGFEVEVENDGTPLYGSEAEMKSNAHDCMLSTEPEIIVECLESQSDTRQGTINHPAPVTSANIVSTTNSAYRRDPRNPESDKPRISAKRQRFGIDKTDKANPVKDTRGSLEMNSDEYTAFSLYVQQEMRKITNPYALQMTKLKINQILFEGTTGIYDRLPSGITSIRTPHKTQMVITSKIQPYEPVQQSTNSESS